MVPTFLFCYIIWYWTLILLVLDFQILTNERDRSLVNLKMQATKRKRRNGADREMKKGREVSKGRAESRVVGEGVVGNIKIH